MPGRRPVFLPGYYDRTELPIGFSAANSAHFQQIEYQQLVPLSIANLRHDVIPLKMTSKEYGANEEDDQLIVNQSSTLTEEEIRGLSALVDKIILGLPELSTISEDNVDAQKELLRVYCSTLRYYGANYSLYFSGHLLKFHDSSDSRPQRCWKDFGPLSYYFTKTKRFVIHVEDELPLSKHDKRELTAYANAYLKTHFPGYKVTLIEESLGAKCCSSENVLRIGTSPMHGHDQIAGLYVEHDSVVYWTSTAHGLINILASVNSSQGASAACVRCIPPEVSLSIDTANTASCTYKCFKYFDQKREPEPGLSPSVDIMLGPVSVLTCDLLRTESNDRMRRMGVAGHLIVRNKRIDYYVVEICGYSVAGPFSWQRPRVYATLQPGQPMVEGVIMTVLGDGGQMFIRDGLPSKMWASGLLAIAPCYTRPADANPEGVIVPEIGHSGSVWCVLNGGTYPHSCKAFSITVAIANNFVSEEDSYKGPVWLVSDLHVSLKKMAHSNRSHFGSCESFKCIGSYFCSPLPDTLG